jgi:uncharacterized protein (TIGR02391 family)
MTTSESNVQTTPWSAPVVQALADILASTTRPGLSSNELERLLATVAIPDVLDAPNKRSRLATALLEQQQRDGTSTAIARFLTEAMAPARYLRDHTRFDELRTALSEPLSLLGLEVTTQGRLGPALGTATTLDEVGRIAGRLRTELRRRSVHDEVLRYCEEELIRQSLFHAVFEATKGVSQRLRQMSGLAIDGVLLVDACFSANGGPRMCINAYETESDTSEQKGFANLIKGIFGTFRNPPAHTTRVTGLWNLTEPDALDLFSMLSFVHRRLDRTRVDPPRQAEGA